MCFYKNEKVAIYLFTLDDVQFFYHILVYTRVQFFYHV